MKIRDSKNKEYEKVILLDIDGVLNDESTKSFKKKIFVEEIRVKRLKDIVQATQAKIVMSSSWRHYFKLYNENPESIKDNYELSKMKDLKNMLDKYDLSVSDYTQYLETGPDARPLEIRQWMLDKANLKRFVILDDDDFWNWSWLTDYFVMTKRKGDNYNMIRGLEDDHVKCAIKILNRQITFY